MYGCEAIELFRLPFSAELVANFLARLRKRSILSVVIEPPDFLGLPKVEKDDGRNDGNDAAHDIDQVAGDVVGPKELRQRKRETDHQNGGKNLKGFRPADHGAHQPEGDDDSSQGENAADHCVQVRFRKPANRGQSVDRSADGAPGYRSGVRYEIQGGRMEGAEAEPDHEGSGDGD